MKFSFCQGRWPRSGGLEVWVVPCALQYLVTFRFVLRYAFSGDIYVTCVNFMEHGMHGAMVQGAELEILRSLRKAGRLRGGTGHSQIEKAMDC